MNTRFKDRKQAGELLARELMQFGGRDDVIVLGLPRGGVPVAYEVATRLHAPLDVMIVRKLGLPGHEELAMGAIASGGVEVFQDFVVRSMGVTREDMDRVAAEQLQELRRRELAYRGHEGAPEIADKVVILVDDGIATGSTIRAAVQALRQQALKQIIIAVPVASSDACTALEPMVNELVALMTPEDFQSVGQWYEEFTQTTDAEVTQLLAQAAKLSHTA